LLRQQAVAHAQHPHRDALDIDRLDRQAVARRARQDEAVARQRDLRRPVAEADLDRLLALRCVRPTAPAGRVPE